METTSIKNSENETTNSINSSTVPNIESAGQAASLSSLEEIAAGHAKRARRRPTLDRQHSDSSNWTIGGSSGTGAATGNEDGGSERVRFDDHVSFIEADDKNEATSVTRTDRSIRNKKRNKDCDDIEAQKISR